jgi:hypothetical protein
MTRAGTNLINQIAKAISKPYSGYRIGVSWTLDVDSQQCTTALSTRTIPLPRLRLRSTLPHSEW